MIPSTLILSLEWGAFEFLILLAGYLGKDQIAAQVIIVNICYVFYIISYGISRTASTLIGNSIGSGNVK